MSDFTNESNDVNGINESAENSADEWKKITNATEIIVSKKEFIEEKSETFNADLRKVAILSYVLIAINFIIAAAFKLTTVFIDIIVALLLVCGMHLKKSKLCAILFLIYACISSIVGMAASGTVTGWLWLYAGIKAVSVFRKVDKEYKGYVDYWNKKNKQA